MLKILWRFFPWLIILILLLALWISLKTPLNFFTKKEPEIRVSQTTVLQQIESMGKLELVKYHFKDVIEFEKEQYSWLPTAKIIIIAGGEAVGCIDLRKITDPDVSIVGDTAIITLPQPEICYFKINHENSKIYDMEYTFFQDKTLVDQAYREAEKQLKKAALDFNILSKTKENAELTLKPVFERITQKKVFFLYKNEPVAPKIKKN